MYNVNSRETIKESEKRGIIDMLRRERKWNLIKSSVKTTKEKEWKI